MPDHGTPRPLFRRAALGCAAVLSLALACACGTAQGAQSAPPQVSVGPSSSAPTTTPAPSIPPVTPSSPFSSPFSSAASAPSSAATAPSSAAGPTTSAPASGTPRPASGTPTPGASAPAVPSAPGAPSSTPAAPATTSAARPPAPVDPAAAIVYSTATGGRSVALTFDDGPGPATPQILDLLAQYNAKATFCEIGPQAAANPAVVKRVLAAGHRLCDHTVHHPQPMHTLPHDTQVYEIDAAKDMITQAGGPDTEVSWFRAPGGDFSADNRAIAVQDGLRPLGWTVDTRDWSRPGAAAILATAQHELRPGGIILMHDGGGDRTQTVAALKLLLPWLVQQGYTFDFPAS